MCFATQEDDFVRYEKGVLRQKSVDAFRYEGRQVGKLVKNLVPSSVLREDVIPMVGRENKIIEDKSDEKSYCLC